MLVTVPMQCRGYDNRCRGDLEQTRCMSRNERRYERALAALKAIARTMGNVVFRVEDFRSPRTRSRIGHQDAQRDEHRGRAENPSSIAKRAGRDGL
jgi:hypothetical protein